MGASAWECQGLFLVGGVSISRACMKGSESQQLQLPGPSRSRDCGFRSQEPVSGLMDLESCGLGAEGTVV